MWLYNALQRPQWTRRLLYHLLSLSTLSADSILWFPLPPLIWLLSGQHSGEHLHPQGAYYTLFKLYLGCVSCAVVELLLKPALGRTRPALAVNAKRRFTKAEHYSCPSGHAMRAFYVATTYLGSRPAALLWATLVAISRVAMGRHYPLDVLAGSLLGVGVQKLFVVVGLQARLASYLTAAFC